MSETTSLFREDGKRLDGRDINELRPIRLQVGVLERADGSALVEHGKNKILVAVYGPRELHPKHLALADRAYVRCEYRLATFSVGERKSPAPRRREHEISKVMKEALEPVLFVERYPRSVVDIYVQVLDADGGTRCASITGASLALADAGVPMRGFVSSVAVGKIDGKVVLDLSDVEDKEGEGDLPLAVIVGSEEITLLQLDGQFTSDEVKTAIEMGLDASKIIFEKQRQAIMEKYAQIGAMVEEEDQEEEE